MFKPSVSALTYLTTIPHVDKLSSRTFCLLNYIFLKRSHVFLWLVHLQAAARYSRSITFYSLCVYVCVRVFTVTCVIDTVPPN